MGKKDPRVDRYIEKSADFAKPILNHLRKLAHAAHPEIEETLKWGFPHFVHRGILFGMGAFKAHCTMGFWKGKLILAKDGRTRADEAMGQFGRITGLADLPADKVLVGYIKQAVRLNEENIKVPSKPRAAQRPKLVIPACLKTALKKNKKALAAFEAFSYSHKKEYVQWITEAKTEETRNRRLETALDWLAQGKSRHWKYEKC